jgi:hypothetical protein
VTECRYNFGMRNQLLICCLAIIGFTNCLTVIAQEQPSEQPKKYMTPQARMAAAKNVYLRNTAGTDIPFNVIQAGIESWPRYAIVNSPDQADLIIEVQAPEESTGSAVGANVSTDKGANAHASKGTTASRDFAEIQFIKLTVLDAKTKVALFSASERPKNAWKEKARTESQIECAQKLLAALHNRVEPQENAQPDASPK